MVKVQPEFMRIFIFFITILFSCVQLESGIISREVEEEHLIDSYLSSSEILAIMAQWDALVSEGTRALQEVATSGRLKDEAKICAQLTSISFYQGNYAKALEYANRCHELSESLEDFSLFLRTLCFESAIHRALAGRQTDEMARQMAYSHAIKIAEEAALAYDVKGLDNPILRGKIYFNWGAAHADNPKGDLTQARACYLLALHNFKYVNATDDMIRTMVRLGKIHLLLKEYSSVEEIIREVRSQGLGLRVAMHVEYLEAELKYSIMDYSGAVQFVKRGLALAEELGAKEDQCRLQELLQKIESLSYTVDTRSILETVKMLTKAEDSAYQSSVLNLLDELTIHSAVLREGRDEDIRPLFVNAQIGSGLDLSKILS